MPRRVLRTAVCVCKKGEYCKSRDELRYHDVGSVTQDKIRSQRRPESSGREQGPFCRILARLSKEGKDTSADDTCSEDIRGVGHCTAGGGGGCRRARAGTATASALCQEDKAGKTYAVPDAELVDAWVDAEPPEEEAPLVAEEPADEVVASVEAALELVDEAPVAVLLEPEPDAADEEPELVKQLSAAVHDHSQHPLFEPRQIRGTYSQTAR